MWIVYSAVMFFSSVSLYLAVRKASLLNTPNQLVNLAMFAVPLPLYALLAVFTKAPFALPLRHLLLLLVTAVFCAFLGNVASLKAISRAPNPGYSLILSKSYVLFTTFFAFAVLGASLTQQKIIAILLIVLFSSLVMFERSRKNTLANKSWVALSLYSFFAWGFLSISSKYLFTHGIRAESFLVLLYLVVTVCILLSGQDWPKLLQTTSRQAYLVLFFIGISSTLFNLGQFFAIRSAPNIGYVNAINAASIGIVAIAAAVIYKDALNARKLIGISGVIVGLCLLLL